MFVLEVLLGLKSLQGDITCAFLHADLEENEKVYVDMPLGFSQYDKNEKKMCLKLKKTPYGLCQSPRAFWKYITEVGLEHQSSIHACLLAQMSFALFMLMTQFSGPKRYHGSILLPWSSEIWD